ncbi:MAG: dTDP-4-dehydrorhamnose reductase [Myxococcota bacterium]|nr:dTDP-4-dehydrorhamnose reductase [Myxococcota bacterium]
MKTLLVFGQSGQLARALAAEAPMYGCAVICAGHERGDLAARPQAAVEIIAAEKPGLVINAAAYTAVDLAEKEEEKARAINALAPELMAKECGNQNIPFIHVSTDYVFDGRAGRPYVESDTPHPLNAYGRTKLEGEQRVLSVRPQAMVVRTSAVYERGGKNFVDTIRRLVKEKNSLRVVNDQIVSLTRARTLARQLLVLAEQPEGGLYHATAQGEAAWFAIAGVIRDHENAACELVPITTVEYGAPADRPRYSVLDNARLRLRGLDRMHHWREDLMEYLDGG